MAKAMMKHEEIYISVPRGGLLIGQDDMAISEEWNYWAMVIQDKGSYYYWAKGISLEIDPMDVVKVIQHPFLTTDSMAFKLHQQIDILKNLSGTRKAKIQKYE